MSSPARTRAARRSIRPSAPSGRRSSRPARRGERSTARADRPAELALGRSRSGAFPVGGAAFDGPPWARGAPAPSRRRGRRREVARSVEATPFRAIVRGIAIFTAATIAVLGAAFLFALGSAALVGYLLSRQLVRRLERLGGAVEALAAGDLGQRVEDGPRRRGRPARPSLQRDGRAARDDRRGARRPDPRGRGGAGREARAGRQRLPRAADAARLDQRPRRVAADARR